MGKQRDQRVLTTGQLANAAGLTRKALRVYESKGLLPEARRSAAGYRLYTDRDLELLTFIRQARTLGLHLDDIGDILAIRDGGTAPCAAVRELLDTRMAEVDTAIAELRALRQTLEETRRTASDCADDQEATVCAIIERTRPST